MHTQSNLSGARTVSPALLVSQTLPGKKDVEKVLEHKCTAVCVSISSLSLLTVLL